MRFLKLFYLVLAISIVLVLSVALPVNAKVPNTSSQTYTVMVGLENPHQGIGVNAYFPDNVTIHVGDTVHWVQNTNEIHTVTFLDGLPFPELIVPSLDIGADPNVSPLAFNPFAVNPSIPPGGLYNGGIGAFANSGLMGREQGQVREFDLTFTTEGSYYYICLVHGAPMSGTVTVVGDSIATPSPNQTTAEGKKEMAQALSQVPAVTKAAQEQIMPPATNSDGTVTHHVMIGYSDGQIDLMQFFPDKLVVRPGDTVTWEMSEFNEAPHTVTFLNGEEEPGLVTVVPQPAGPPLLYLNPATLFQYPINNTLTRDEIFNSGIMNPVPGTTYTLQIGDMTPGLQPWLCLLHDTSGMKGVLMVVPGK
jgi:plastocyanin